MAGSRQLDAWILQLADTPQELTKLRRRVMLQSISKQCCRPEPEDQKPPEPLYRLNEFQEVIALVSEMDCGQRLFYLINQTVTLRDAITQLHADVMGLAGIFIQLLRHLLGVLGRARPGQLMFCVSCY
ncbi:unnamed protein product [Cladocopium goreaui]|uniref:Uncharacterized protein n=1 Tax=Cladocopium goreaui TaxID=2562237 RepID=A0A9P1DDU0_9DINO|nr:unnamed protein product [Cladocopium goreaui]